MKYKSKPVEIEAIKFTEELALDCLLNQRSGPFGLYITGSWNQTLKTLQEAYINIETLEGVMRANVGDWIIKGLIGEFYPCKDEVFQKKYEAIK